MNELNLLKVIIISLLIMLLLISYYRTAEIKEIIRITEYNCLYKQLYNNSWLK